MNCKELNEFNTTIFIINEPEYNKCHVFEVMILLRTSVIRKDEICIANKGLNAEFIFININKVADIC